MSSLLLLAVAGLSLAPAHSQSPDTIRVGSVVLAPLSIRVDTFDIDFETPTPNGPQRQRNISIVRISQVTSGTDTVVRVRFDSERMVPYWEVDLDRRTLATLRYEQHTNIDSLIVMKRGDCITGWVDMQNTPRRHVTCDRFTDRFAGSPMDQHFLALLPLRVGQSSVLATFSAVSGVATGYAFAVAGQDTLTLAGKGFRAWRIEQRLTTDRGVVASTIWVDRDRPRVIRASTEFPNGRRSVRTLRNP